jgi:hypothetical protein
VHFWSTVLKSFPRTAGSRVSNMGMGYNPIPYLYHYRPCNIHPPPTAAVIPSCVPNDFQLSRLHSQSVTPPARHSHYEPHTHATTIRKMSLLFPGVGKMTEGELFKPRVHLYQPNLHAFHVVLLVSFSFYLDGYKFSELCAELFY